MYKRELKVLFVLSLLWVGLATAAIPVTIEVTDVPDDSGDALKVVWVAEDPQFAVNFPSVTLQRTELGYLELALKGHKSNDAAPEEAKKEVLPTATVKFKTGTIPEVKSISIKNDGKTIVLLDASMKEVKSIQGKDTYDLLNKLKSQPGFVVNILNIQLVLNDAENLPLEAYKTVIEKREIGDSEYTDTDLEPSGKYKYKLIPLNKDGLPSELFVESKEISPVAQWFHMARLNILIAAIIFCGLILLFISIAKKGKDLYIRKISGLSAVDEAIGRATEMGKPILFVPGIGGIADIETIASMVILNRVARKAAEYDTPIYVPCCDPIVMTTAQEIVKEGYIRAGRPDAFNPDYVNFITQDQFGYTAGVNGLMMREKPGSIFLLGYFAAESLLLAETGHETGAIQIAGTAQASQLPFFVTACDYTLIGEEFFAASAYLSREPILIGTLIGQDWGKIVILLSLLALLVLSILCHFQITDFNPTSIFIVQ